MEIKILISSYNIIAMLIYFYRLFNMIISQESYFYLIIFYYFNVFIVIDKFKKISQGNDLYNELSYNNFHNIYIFLLL